MRIAAVALFVVLFVPQLAAAKQSVAGAAECRRLTHQIEHFEALAERARELESDVWAGRVDAHLVQLVDRRAAYCPGYGTEEQIAAQFAALAKLVGSAALSYFTFGAF